MVLFLQMKITLNGYGFSLLIQKKNRFGCLRIKGRYGLEDKTCVKLLYGIWFIDLSLMNTMTIMAVIGIGSYYDVVILLLYLTLLSFSNCYTSTQNKGLRKVMLKFITLKLMSYFNSINSSESPITLICFI
jgi:hypothetical protein